ncbi:hypothetical protein NX722_02715 [Endozoicomonas gorgoniicola]|uniref:Fungal lipase-like domain-containing protein n=1 Tax=Endozoicomonas gorgoniicola TaxID=1234144 RepID=A0ABT3MQC4_9GAMM|nr:hypothetical protein [Endozoicomonas gorgoniicola]MCW7551574.1 hypothetical protein [Endozoicomonas gorgoniicola]
MRRSGFSRAAVRRRATIDPALANAQMASFPYHQDESKLPPGYLVEPAIAFKITKSAQQLPGGQDLTLVNTSAYADASSSAGASTSTSKPLNIITSKSGLVAYVILGKGTYNLVFGGTTSGATAGNLTQRSKANLSQTLSQWAANLKNGLGGLPQCYVEAQLLLAALIKHAGFNVAVYGHSLGA